jgi:methyltransferase-like protein
LLRKELALLKACTDSYLLHEYLEDVNSPVYFHEFVERSARHNLQYLADSDFGSMLMSGFPDETAETLQKISPDIVSSEQYMDFVRNRSFRQALLCHKEHPLKRDLGPEDIEGMLITFAAGIESEPPNLLPGVKQVFRTRQGSTIETDYPLTKAAFAVLKLLWPRAIDLDSLFLEARELLDGVPLVESADWPHARQILAQDILKCYAGNAVELHTWQPDYVIEIGNAPRVSQIASYQINRGPSVVNQRHEMVNLDPFSAQIVTLLDGTRDRAALLQCLIGLVENGTLTLQERGNPITNRLLLEKALATAAEQTLASLAGSALLVE